MADQYYVKKRKSGEWAVIRVGTPRPAAIFPTQAEAVAYANQLTELCTPYTDHSQQRIKLPADNRQGARNPGSA